MFVHPVGRRVLSLVVVLPMVGSLLAVVAPAASAAGGATCAGGVIAPGTYRSLDVTGTCMILGGSVRIVGGLTVAPGGTLMAISSAADVTVSGGMLVETGGVLLFGCAPSLTELCGPDTSYVVNGDVVSDGALAVILHGNTIHGAVSLAGGGGGLTCAPQILGGQGPAYYGLEGNAIDGGLTVVGLRTCWFGIARNAIHGSVSLQDNVEADPDSNEVIANAIDGGLACSGDIPDPHNDGQPNAVSGLETGQCAGL